MEKYWNENWKYFKQAPPWETNNVDPNLIEVLQEISFSSAFEIGSGSGVNANYLSQYSPTTALDISEYAITYSKEKYKNSNIEFVCSNFIDYNHLHKYDFIFDRGCYHGLGTIKDREDFLNKVSQMLSSKGKFLCIIGSAEDINNNEGPPRHTLTQIVSYFDRFLKIEKINQCTLGNNSGVQSPAFWILCSLRTIPLNITYNY